MKHAVYFFGSLVMMGTVACRKPALTQTAAPEKPVVLIKSQEAQPTESQEAAVKLDSDEVRKATRLPRSKQPYLNAKIKLHYRDSQNNETVKVKLRMKQDSVIWVSITGPLGIEGLRANILRDSVMIIDRMNKEYTATNFEELSRRLNFRVDFDMLQAILLGDMPMPNQAITEQSQSGKMLTIRQRVRGIEIDNLLNEENHKLSRLDVQDNATKSILNLLYESFKHQDDNWFPEVSKIKVRYRNKQTQADGETQIDMQCSEVEFSTEQIEFPFDIPQKFKKN